MSRIAPLTGHEHWSALGAMQFAGFRTTPRPVNVLLSNTTGTQAGSYTPIEPVVLTKLFFETLRLLLA